MTMSEQKTPLRTKGVDPRRVDPVNGRVEFEFHGDPKRLHVRSQINGNDAIDDLNDFHRTVLVETNSNDPIDFILLGTNRDGETFKVSAFGITRHQDPQRGSEPQPDRSGQAKGDAILITTAQLSGTVPWVTIAFTAVAESDPAARRPTYTGDPLVILVPKKNEALGD